MDFATLYSWFMQIVIGGAVILVLLLVLLYFAQNHMLYLPVIQPLQKDMDFNPQGYRNPSEYQLPYEDVAIQTKDGVRLHGWFIKQSNPKTAPTIIYFHENAGNLGTRLPYLANYHSEVRANVLLVAYRGFSKSEGIPTEQGLLLDGPAILEFLLSREDIDRKQIFVHGRSLGGAVTIATLSGSKALQDRVAGVILENTFTSISDMVDTIFPKLKWFKGLVLRNFWPSVDRIPKITRPILFVMSLQDEIVPYPHMVKLFTSATAAVFKDKYEIAQGNHNMNWSLEPEAYFTRVKNFIEKTKEYPLEAQVSS